MTSFNAIMFSGVKLKCSPSIVLWEGGHKNMNGHRKKQGYTRTHTHIGTCTKHAGAQTWKHKDRVGEGHIGGVSEDEGD